MFSRFSSNGIDSRLTISLSPGAAMAKNSFVSSAKGRIPPTENSNNSFSGKASITLRVRFRCPCQWVDNSVEVKNVVFIIILLLMIIEQKYRHLMTTVCQLILKEQKIILLNSPDFYFKKRHFVSIEKGIFCDSDMFSVIFNRFWAWHKDCLIEVKQKLTKKRNL